MAKIVTVTGEISPDQLGFTSMHDHIIMTNAVSFDAIQPILPPIPEYRKPFTLENMTYIRSTVLYHRDAMVVEPKHEELLLNEIEAFKRSGGQSILECSAIEMRGDVTILKRISEKTGVHIICCTGFGRTGNYTPEIRALSEDERYNIIMDEITNGIGDTGIKPGFIKTMPETPGANGQLLEEQEMISFRAAARAAAETGMPWLSHCLPAALSGDVYEKLADIAINEYGVNPDKIVFCHQDHCSTWTSVSDYIKNKTERVIDFERVERLIKKGINVGIDTFGCQMGYDSADFWAADDYTRLKLASWLIEHGYGDKFVFGNDLFPTCEGVCVGMPGYGRIAEFAVPTLKKIGYSEETVNKIVIDTPARIMSF